MFTSSTADTHPGTPHSTEPDLSAAVMGLILSSWGLVSPSEVTVPDPELAADVMYVGRVTSNSLVYP